MLVHLLNLLLRLDLKSAYLLPSHGERSVEPLLEGAAALEDGGQQEVEQRPELGELVL